MSRFPFVLSSIAVAVLAGCAAEHHVTPAPAPVVVSPAPVVATPAPAAPAVVVPQASGAAVVVPPTPGPLRVGFGRIDSITPIQ